MEPKLPTPESGSYERAPIAPHSPELMPNAAPERVVSPERPAPAERQPGSRDNTGAPVQQVPVAPTPQPLVDDTHQVVDDNPIVAADEDLIEKEWVDRAKSIIERTKHDPYEQEREISRLHADYLKKRYGKDVKMPSGE